MRHTQFTKTMLAAGTIVKRRLVAFGANEGEVVQASDPAAVILGINSIYDREAGEDTDVELAGAQPVEAGGAIAYGDEVTTDAQGRAVTAAAGNKIIGHAMSVTTASGQLVDVFIDRK